jgi:ribokinase
MKTLICGGIAIDDIRLPGEFYSKVVGGSAIYASLAASLFSPTILSGVVGQDFPKDYLEKLKKKKVDLSNVQYSKLPSFRWKGKYSDDLSGLITTDQRTNAFSEFRLDGLENVAKNCKVVFLSNIDPDIQFNLMKNLPCKVVKMLDSMDLWIVEEREKLKKVLAMTDVFFVSSREARLLVEQESPFLEVVEKIMLLGPKVVVVKKGEHGLTMYGKMGTIAVPSYPLSMAIDPSGAGDSLGGAVAGVLSSIGRFDSSSMATAIVVGNIVASFVVEGISTSSLLDLTKDEVVNRAKTFLSQLPNSVSLQLESL